MKIFIPGAGNKVSHILNFKELPQVSKIIISDIHNWSCGNFVADASYLTPPFSDASFLKSVENIYAKEHFDFCIPIHDASLMLFAELSSQGVRLPYKVAMNPIETIRVIADKMLTYQFFIDCDMPTPKTWLLSDFIQHKEYKFPYYLKPKAIHLRGTQKAYFMAIEDRFDLDYACKKLEGRTDEFVVQEFARGTEYNIDFFCDDKGQVKSVVPLKRLGMGASRGISRGEIVFDERFKPYVEKIASKLKLWGANQLQVYVDENGSMKFMEINGRFSGSSVFVKEAGVNFFEYFIKLLNGETFDILEKPKALSMTSWESPRYYTNSPINTTLMK